jgi:hypothetical protein
LLLGPVYWLTEIGRHVGRVPEDIVPSAAEELEVAEQGPHHLGADPAMAVGH